MNPSEKKKLKKLIDYLKQSANTEALIKFHKAILKDSKNSWLYRKVK